MRLLNVKTFKLRTFHDYDIPPYAILSHTWLQDTEEVTFAHLEADDPDTPWLHLPGAKKILYLCKQAAAEGYRYAWADTCCIDKSSSSELNEAINSMFKWYQNAQICYAYLSDIISPSEEGITSSRWWKRSWTLQELLAPEDVTFYDSTWTPLGTKAQLATVISEHTGIDLETIEDPFNMHMQSIAVRMSWAANRTATRSEDLAYSLLGIFDVTLSMQYGEGSHAFLRLQEKLLTTTNDQSLFTWGYQPRTIVEVAEQHVSRSRSQGYLNMEFTSPGFSPNWHEEGIFADHPSRFEGCKDIIFFDHHAPQSHIARINGVFRIELMYVKLEAPQFQTMTGKCGFKRPSHKSFIALLPCGSLKEPNHLVGILLEMWTEDRYRRSELFPDVFTFLVPSQLVEDAKSQEFLIDDARWIARHQHGVENKNYFHQSVRVMNNLPADRYHIQMENNNFTADGAYYHFQHCKRSLWNTLAMIIQSSFRPDQLRVKAKFLWSGQNVSMSRLHGGYLLSVERGCREVATSPWGEVVPSVEYDGIRVEINSQWVYNHLLSTMTISSETSNISQGF